MESNKYYTPDIKEFHEGFEYEVYNGVGFYQKKSIEDKESDNWNLKVYKLELPLTELLELNNIRVKFLDQKDIESLGWKYIGGKLIKNYKDDFLYKKDNYKQYNLSHIHSYNIIRIDLEDLNVFEQNINYLFQGVIKNKSELKKLMKQLQIND